MGRIRIASLFLTAALLGAALSCGDDSFGVNNVSPTGSIGGLIVDAGTMKALEGVKVVVIAGGNIYPSADDPALTDAEGYFSVKGVPAGDVLVEVAPADAAAYRAIRIATSLDNAAGDYPLGNSTLTLGPIGLLPLTDTKSEVVVQLVTPAGEPAAQGLKAYLRTGLEWVDFHGGTIVPHGTMILEGTTDKAGLVHFAGVPDYSRFAGLIGSTISDAVTIQVPPHDSNKDGVLDFLGCEKVINLSRRSVGVPTIVLKSANRPTQLSIEAASIAGLMGKTGNQMLSSVNGPIYVTFNMPLLEDEVELTLYDEKGTQVASKPTATVLDNLLTINFPSLTPGSEYNLNVHAVASVDGENIESGLIGTPFFTPSSANLTVTRLERDGNKITVTFSEPIGLGTSFSLSGTNSVIYFDYDLDGSTTKGDSPGEKGASTSTVGLVIDEIDPPGAAGKSGYSRTWYFNLPTLSGPVTTPPAGTAVDILFSRAAISAERPDGSVVPDFKSLSLP